VKPSLHTLTNMAVIEKFLPVQFGSSEQDGRWTIGVSKA
jgi:RNA 3'-terminal phosphate cyclase